jgi:FolB domain-containing protein
MGDSHVDWLHLQDFTFTCMLGLLEWEQREVQRLRVDLSLGLDLDEAAGGDLRRSINYATLLEQVQFIAQQGRWLLLESMGAAIARHVLAAPSPIEERAQVAEVVVRLTKPDVFKGRAVPAVELRRNQEWGQARTISVQGSQVSVLQETRETGAYRIYLQAGEKWPVPAGMSVHVVAGHGSNHREAAAPGASIARAMSPVISATGGDVVLLGVSQPPLNRIN